MGAAYAVAEPRALLEYGALAATWPLLLARSEPGDGHPVLLFPPWLGDDAMTWSMRRLLRARGYDAQGWRLGRNLGANPRLVEKVVARVEELFTATGRRVTLIGWSAGGIAARESARERPECVRAVITLGSPFQQDVRQTLLGRAYRRLSGPDFEQVVNDESVARVRTPPPVPSTAIYSESDGVVGPEACQELPSPLTENIRVPGSHCGLAHNPLALYVVLDRLAQREGGWRRFEAAGARSLWFDAAAHPRRPSFEHATRAGSR